MFKIALTAGHYLYTPGKRCLKSLDPNETREWVLNDRIADKVEKLLTAYEGYSLIRTDDTTGEKKINNIERCRIANNFKADIYISIHHNAGINGGSGGGIMAFTYLYVDEVTREWQEALYKSLIKHTGLVGNRSDPVTKADFEECRETNMPAVLLELGYMDSKTDTPIILTEKYAEECATAIVEVIVEKGGLKKKAVEPYEDKPQVTYKVRKSLEDAKSQVGAYKILQNAIAKAQETECNVYDNTGALVWEYVPEKIELPKEDNVSPEEDITNEENTSITQDANIIIEFIKFIVKLIKSIWTKEE